MQLAQQLYEKHKVLTYPRTDSRYLPEDYIDTVKSTMRSFADPTLVGARRQGTRQRMGPAIQAHF